jgi:hypothetical protein
MMRTAIELPSRRGSQLYLKNATSIENSITALLFVVLICVFGVVTAWRFSIPAGTASSQENRVYAACPHLRLSNKYLGAFAKGFDAFYNDRFAFRYELINFVSLIKYEAFTLSTSDKVLVGNNGWLFFMDGGDEETLRRSPLFSQMDLVRWASMLEKRRAWCASRNIKFLFVITPSKSTIYREFVPAQYAYLNPQTRTDQLCKYLKLNSKVEWLDLRAPLLAAKSKGLLYLKTDTHWNRLGGFIGYQAMMTRLTKWFPQLKPIALQDIELEPHKSIEGDLASMIGLGHVLVEPFTDMQRAGGRHWHFAESPTPHALTDYRFVFQPYATETNAKKGLRCVFIRDSFLIMPQEFLSEHFQRAYYSWTPAFDFPVQAIEQETPDLLVFEMTERSLCRPVPLNPPELELVE